MDELQSFDAAREATGFALGGAFAALEEARAHLEALAAAADDRVEIDLLIGSIAIAAKEVERVAVAVDDLAPDGTRRW